MTAHLGKIACIARGARRSKKRFAGGLPVGAIGEARIAPGRGSLAVLEGFAPQRDHSRLGRDLEVFAYVAYVCELLDELSVEGGQDTTLFAIVVEAIELCMVDGAHPAVLRAFELRLLAALGLMPELESCAVCGEPCAEGATLPFDLLRGGALCLRHAAGAQAQPRALLELARALLGDGGKRALEDRNLGPGLRRGLRDLCLTLIKAQLRRPLRSISFFQQLKVSGGAKTQEAAASDGEGEEE
jgi:DNA repair protein RecO (recombination protein O)